MVHSKSESTDTSSSFLRRIITKGTGHTERGYWNSHAEFLLSCIGFSVGLGNLWRFPYKANTYGGAAFLVAYILLQLVVGIPMYFLELAIGQYSGLGPIGIFRCNPSAKGVGIAMVLITIVIAIFYNVILAYTVYYMFASFINPLPWTNCEDEWISEHNCYTPAWRSKSMPLCGSNITSNLTNLCKCSGVLAEDFNLSGIVTCPEATHQMNYEQLNNVSLLNNCTDLLVCTNETVSPSHFYFYQDVIQRDGHNFTHKLSSIGQPIWYLVLCLLVTWIVICLCLLKGIKSSGKVVYFTATFPYFVILALIIRSTTLQGSLTGIEYFLIPDWQQLSNIKVWMEAGSQMFFSLGISFGSITTLGSYNRFRNNIYRDALIITTVDLVTSILAGIVVFSTLGAMSHETGVDINQFTKYGFGLVFVTYPEALSQLPTPHFWSVVFFFMFFTLGVDSQFAMMENILTSLVDEFPQLHNYKLFLTIGSCVIGFLLGLPLMTPGGTYLMTILDDYGVSMSFYIVCFAEIVAISWVYGVRRFLCDVTYMLGFRPQPIYFWAAAWSIISPLVVAIIGVAGIYSLQLEQPKYSDGTPFEDATVVVGSILVACTTGPISMFAVVAVVRARGKTLKKKIKKAFSPSPDWRAQKHEGSHQSVLLYDEN